MKVQMAYAVYRRRLPGEERNNQFEAGSLSRFFGWSESKARIRLFHLQRDPKKYLIREIPMTDIKHLGSRQSIENLQLDIVNLRSNHFKRDVAFVTTTEEKIWFEDKIRKLFDEACTMSNSIKRSDVELTALILAISNLRPAYAKALETIGYRCAELNAIFDSVDDDDAGIYSEYDVSKAGYGLTVGQVIIYSLESVVKVLLEEM